MSQKLKIPHLDIDRLWFEGGGHTTPLNDVAGRANVDAHIKAKVEEFIQQDAWVTDGWYGKVLPAIAAKADTILFLDVPLRTRILSHVWRTFFEERHKELTTWDDVRFVYKMIQRTRKHGPKMREFVKEHTGKVQTLHSYREINDYVNNLDSTI